MKDRIPANPGRVLITPESGGAPYYATVTRADNPTQEGTRLNKYNLLKDATAAMFNLDSGAVPDSVFGYIGKYAQHWWKRLALVAATRYREKKTQLASGTFFVKRGAKYYKSVSVDPVTGEITPQEPFDIVSVDDYYNAYVVGDFVVNKGASTEYTDNAGVYYFTSGISKKGSDTNGSTFYQNYVQAVTAEAYQINVGGTDFVQSPNAEAYPHSGSDGSFEYTYLGQPWENAVASVSIATGSYTGTGTRLTSSSPQTLTFDFPPAVLIIIQATSDRIYGVGMENKGTDVIFLCSAVRAFKGEAWCPYNLSTQSNSDYMLYVKTVGNSVSFYPDYSNTADFNDSGRVFHYFTIG